MKPHPSPYGAADQGASPAGSRRARRCRPGHQDINCPAPFGGQSLPPALSPQPAPPRVSSCWKAQWSDLPGVPFLKTGSPEGHTGGETPGTSCGLCLARKGQPLTLWPASPAGQGLPTQDPRPVGGLTPVGSVGTWFSWKLPVPQLRKRGFASLAQRGQTAPAWGRLPLEMEVLFPQFQAHLPAG